MIHGRIDGLDSRFGVPLKHDVLQGVKMREIASTKSMAMIVVVGGDPRRY